MFLNNFCGRLALPNHAHSIAMPMHGLRNILAALIFILMSFLFNPTAAWANQTPSSTSGAGTVASPVVKTYPSTLQITYTFNPGTTLSTVFSANTALNSIGGVVSTQLSPQILATTNAMEIDISGTTCQANATCVNRGTLTIDFNRPVTNPVLHLSGMGANVTGTNSSTGVQINYHTQLNLTSSVGTLSATPFTVLAGTNLSASGNQIGPSAITGAISCAVSPSAACGSVRVNGTVTRLVFRADLLMQSANTSSIITSTTNYDGISIATSVDEDFGDAPNSYDGSAAASHIVGGLYMGASVTPDNIAITNTGSLAPSPLAGAGATNDTDNGVTMPVNLFKSTAATIPVSVTGAGALHAWFDWNGDGVFAAGEKIANAVTDGGAGDTDGTVNGVITLSVTPPSTAVVTQSYARFRYSSAATVNPTGLVNDGEVEDYAYTVKSVLVATTELGIVSAGTTSTAIANVAANDTIDGVAATLGASGNTTVAQSGTWPTGIALNTTTGAITVSSSVAPGAYQVTYQLCDKAAPTNCTTVVDDIFVNGTLTPAAPASPTMCGISGSWKQIMFNNVLTGSNANGVTATATLGGPVSYVGNDNQPLVFDSSEYTMGSPSPLVASRFTIGSPISLQTTPGSIVWNFTQTPARELRMHYNSVDNLRLTFNPAANPDIGWTVLSNVRSSNLATAPNLSLGDNDVRDGDASFADAYADGNSGGFSADGTIRFYSISGNPITQLNLGWADQAGKEGLDIGFIALETCGFRPIVADDDSASGVNGVAGANDVVNVLDGDTLGGVAATLATVDLSVVTPATPIGGGPVPVLGADGLVDVPAGTPSGTYTIDYKICEKANTLNCDTATVTITVSLSADLAITKTNNTTTVTSGGTTTYVLTVTNNGPDTATGAVVTDTPGAGITCPAANAVTITGSGVPAGSYTIANLTGAGITLATLLNGQSATLTYTCQVN